MFRMKTAFTTALLIALGVSSAAAFPVKKETPAETASKKIKQAVATFNKGVEHQEKAEPLWDKGDTTKARTEFKKAISEYEKAIKLNDSFAEAYSNLGYCRRHLGDYTKALEAYDRALTLKPNFPEALEYRGETYVKMGRMDEAMADYTKLKGLDSTEAAELWEHIEAAQDNAHPK